MTVFYFNCGRVEIDLVWVFKLIMYRYNAMAQKISDEWVYVYNVFIFKNRSNWWGEDFFHVFWFGFDVGLSNRAKGG